MKYTSQNRNLRQTLGLLESSLDDMDKANRRNWRRHRLVSVKRGDDETMRVSYAPNGNILFKAGVGNCSYDRNVRPHAVTEVENADGKMPGEALTTSFNDFGKIELIDDAGKNLRMDIAYGPDLQGLNALLLKGNFVDERNYYEDFVNHYPWWNTDPVLP